MAQRIGATPEQLTELRRVFDDQASEIDQLRGRIDGKLGSVDWQGPRHDDFVQRWNGDFRRALTQLQQALRDAGREAHEVGERIRQAGS